MDAASVRVNTPGLRHCGDRPDRDTTRRRGSAGRARGLRIAGLRLIRLRLVRDLLLDDVFDRGLVDLLEKPEAVWRWSLVVAVIDPALAVGPGERQVACGSDDQQAAGDEDDDEDPLHASTVGRSFPLSNRVTPTPYVGTMYSTVTSCAMVGVEPRPVRIETSISGGRGIFTIVGLPDAAVRESRERVKAAIRQQGFTFPKGRVLVNLSPADIPKQGSTYDLPIALSILSASFNPPLSFDKFVAVGELSLHGDVRPVRAALGAIDVARRAGRICLVSHRSTISAPDASDVAGIASLAEAVSVARGSTRPRQLEPTGSPEFDPMDLAIVRGQGHARRALEIAAAGGHHLLLRGSPGAGKTLLARCLPSILPPLDDDEEREVALIWSTVGIDRPHGNQPPFRAPHHSASIAALVGGGIGVPSAGEVTKAHRGVLFLDELGEFSPATLDALRQPIEDGVVTVARSGATIRFPSRIQLVASTNPCSCGYLGDHRQPCECTDARLDRYRQRLSGPLVDRFDLRVTVPRMRVSEMRGPGGEPSAVVRRRVLAARSLQSGRGHLNAHMSGRVLDEQAMSSTAEQMLVRAFEASAVTGRGWDRIRRVARTIADLEGSDAVEEAHMAEAVGFRQEAA